MSRWRVLFGVPLFCIATQATAQVPARPADPIFVRAQALVSDGNGVAGRALIDSVLAKTPSTSQAYPQALFWRATLAASAADAESDYKHIVVDYPLAPQAEDALLRLAQLELARGDRDGALGHLQRIPRDYPRSKSLARASYWTARVLFEKNDVPNACAANANALAQADASEVELRNQIQYQGQRCPLPAVVATAAPPPATASANIPAASVTASTTPTTVSTNAPSAPPTTPKQVAPVPTEKPISVDTAPSPAPRLKPPAEANDSKPSIVDPAKAAKVPAKKPVAKPSTTASPNTATKPPAVTSPSTVTKAPVVASPTTTTKPAATASRGRGYSVQVAAYSHKPEAEKLTATLNKRGYSARVDGSIAPFRVRIGRYATEKEAEDALKKIKASHMDGFVVRAPER
jgi:cell division protein FtsN